MLAIETVAVRMPAAGGANRSVNVVDESGVTGEIGCCITLKSPGGICTFGFPVKYKLFMPIFSIVKVVVALDPTVTGPKP